MTLYDLAMVSPQCFIFIRDVGAVTEYKFPGSKEQRKAKIKSVLATCYPMYDHVLEVTLEKSN